MWAGSRPHIPNLQAASFETPATQTREVLEGDSGFSWLPFSRGDTHLHSKRHVQREVPRPSEDREVLEFLQATLESLGLKTLRLADEGLPDVQGLTRAATIVNRSATRAETWKAAFRQRRL